MSLPGLRVDLHNHTRFSSDGWLSPRELLLAAARRGIHCLAVTDHNTLEGALEAAALAEEDPSLPRVIPGIELTTREGEIIALYVSDPIPAGLALPEAIDRVKGQGGLVYLPHPCELVRHGAISRRARLQAASLADIVEVLNGRALTPKAQKKALLLAQALGKASGAGSDAHARSEVGSAFVLVDDYPTRDTLVSLLQRGTVVGTLGAMDYTVNWVVRGFAPFVRLSRELTRH
ncbi:MAG: PHP domain-containing protein [Thermoleophilia bacterium]|nr:PHP domain-containing protein [Thermoleophilia bacterium]